MKEKERKKKENNIAIEGWKAKTSDLKQVAKLLLKELKYKKGIVSVWNNGKE